jgi:pimeloyl-ACP methyl ester carboxylesterase
MSTVELDGIRVDYEIVGVGGGGPAVVLPHARPFVSCYRPLVGALAGRPVLHYRRETPEDPTHGIEDDARLCVRLLAHVGIDRPHVVGHSYGGLVALELARGWPGDIRSIALLEPAPSGLLPPAEAAARMTGLAELARTGGPAAAMDQFLRAVGGPDGPETLERLVPGAVPDTVAHAAGFFAVELPAAVRWSFDPAAAGRVTLPVLHLHGGASSPRFAEGRRILGEYFPTADQHVLPEANHLLPAQQPAVIAELLEKFWRPMAS